ncbi:MAG: hypothetical protein OEU68_03715 [Nitrospira sp.]|nr:hypothetical protein [Nitrospira sp.]MDH4244950.1 hypothetical protein [Nitrospira sp.]MDH4354841.1 hypothetical protein [Nitrospira sp.]MDH5317085.1 hypothetical protein [Nitrospira sp.]
MNGAVSQSTLRVLRQQSPHYSPSPFPFTLFIFSSTSTFLHFLIRFTFPLATLRLGPIALLQALSSVIVGRSDLFRHERPMACRARIV